MKPDAPYIPAFRVKNALLISNLISSIIGVSVVLFMEHFVLPTASEEIQGLARHIDRIFIPAAFIISVSAMLCYEHPFRSYIALRCNDQPVERGFEKKALSRLLNEPFFIAVLDLGIWMAAALVYRIVFRMAAADPAVMQRAFFLAMHTGVITLTAAFFVSEFVLQRRVVPVLFPQGGLSKLSGVIRIRIRIRLTALLLASNLIPLASLFRTVQDKVLLSGDPGIAVEKLRQAVVVNVGIFIIVGLWLTFLVSNNLSRPLQQIIRVLRMIRHGNFEEKVRVTSNDEIGYVGDVINEMTEGLKERDFIKDIFGKYITSEIRDEILSGKIPLDGEIKTVTVMFADLRDFTPMVESTPPKAMVKMMNRYFETMAEAVRRHGGLILQFLGDEIYAVFGAPIARQKHPCSAIEAALDMRRRLIALNLELATENKPALRHGIGIHTGEVLAANIGSPDRMSYLLVGDTVNTASRLQELTKDLGVDILISEKTHACLTDGFRFKRLPAMHIRGKSEPMDLFALDADAFF